jgi:hypothetical protein
MLIHEVRASQRSKSDAHAKIGNQVIALLDQDAPQGIPDPSLILPYIGLYTIVRLNPDELGRIKIPVASFPSLSILSNGQWVSAPPETAPTAPNTARIFDARINDPPESLGVIPLYEGHPQDSQTRYWRLPKATLGGILSAGMLRAVISSSDVDAELVRVRILYGHLQILYAETGAGPPGPSGDGPSGSGSAGPGGGGSARPGGGGPSGGGPSGGGFAGSSPRKRGAQDKTPKRPSKRQARGSGAGPTSAGSKSCAVT